MCHWGVQSISVVAATQKRRSGQSKAGVQGYDRQIDFSGGPFRGSLGQEGVIHG